ncbi:microtubule-associated protein 70-4 [Dorcoceras hygrometricum]|uniref:Microtubule-associated protein 70-4 n=1 Tax=Dorcoceras hygrometricum TaxID=472368 RepID=A0A2Z7C0R9_9LAMI|nr:microtubule-associated protein 70-4 [Dorcoceras hygrometricum]
MADSDLETTSSSSSSESEQEEVHCLIAKKTTDDEVFDFSNTEFTHEDLINALNEMVHEYRKLSQTFEEIKAENGCLKNGSVESSTAQLEDTDSLQTELSKLKIENDLLRTKSCELSSENEQLSQVMSSWTKSSVSLGKLHETQKPLNDKSGLGFSVGESSSGETSTHQIWPMTSSRR